MQAAMLPRHGFRTTIRASREQRRKFYEIFTPRNSTTPEIQWRVCTAYWNGSAQLESANQG